MPTDPRPVPTTDTPPPGYQPIARHLDSGCHRQERKEGKQTMKAMVFASVALLPSILLALAPPAPAQSKRQTEAFINHLLGKAQYQESESSGSTRESRKVDIKVRGRHIVCVVHEKTVRNFRRFRPWKVFRSTTTYTAELSQLDPKSVKVRSGLRIDCSGGRCVAERDVRIWEYFGTCAGGSCRQKYEKKVRRSQDSDDDFSCDLGKGIDRARLARAVRHIVKLHGGITRGKDLFKYGRGTIVNDTGRER